MGNSTAPRPPRIDGHNTKPGQKPDIKPDANGIIQPTTTHGASTFDDPKKAPFPGQTYTLPAGTVLPPGLGVIADGKDVGGTHAEGHHSIVPTEQMTPQEFEDKYNSLPWASLSRSSPSQFTGVFPLPFPFPFPFVHGSGNGNGNGNGGKR